MRSRTRSFEPVLDIRHRFHDREHVRVAAENRGVDGETDRATPARRNDTTGVMPKPVRSSVYGLKLTGVLVSARSLRSSGELFVAWTSTRHRGRAAQISPAPALPGAASSLQLVPMCVVMGRRCFARRPHSLRAISMESVLGPRGAMPSVSSASLESANHAFARARRRRAVRSRQAGCRARHRLPIHSHGAQARSRE